MNLATSSSRLLPSRQGQYVVLSMTVVALLAATFSWWWNYNRGRKALEFFGPEGALLIRTAPHVVLLATATNQEIEIGGAPGFLNARASLLSDASFQWSEPANSISDS